MKQRVFTLALLVVMVLPPVARAGQAAARAANAVVDSPTEQLDLLVGRSAVIRMDRPIARVALSTPEIADALVTSTYELLIHGKTPGTISLLVWADNGRIRTYDVAVRRDLSALDAQIRALFPGEAITVASNGKDVVLSGVVSTKYIVDRASSLAVGYVEKPDNVVNLLRQQGGAVTNQVLLRVRFAEVSRSAMQELGAGFFTGPNGKGDWIGRSTTGQFPAPEFDQDKGLVFSDFLNLFAFNTEEQLGAVVKALKGKGLFQSLAEPNLITQDGREASFLAGGEFPYPVLQGSGANSGVTIVFKEFGVRLKFTPTVTSGDMIHLKVAPEVSSLDFGNAVVLEGFRVPALATRRTETEVELRDGQTFAIAGLLDQNLNETLRRVPGVGDIPILGYLFRSQAYQKNATELVVMITPHIVRRDSSGVTPNLPGLVEPFLPGPPRRLTPPSPAFTSPSSQQRPAAPVAQVASTVEPKVSEPSKRDREKALKLERQRAAVALKERNVARKAEAEREQREQKIERKRAAEEAEMALKRATEQAVIDRRRMLAQQEDSARARDVAARLEKEKARRDAEQLKIDNARLEEERKLAEKHRKAQDKLEKEQANRDAEMERLVSQYRKLKDGQ